MGEMVSVLKTLGYFSYSVSQNDLTTGSVTLITRPIRYSSSVSNRGRSKRVLPSLSESASMAFLSTYSSLGPQNSDQIFLKTEIKPEATRGLCTGLTLSNTLKAMGYSTSAGLK